MSHEKVYAFTVFATFQHVSDGQESKNRIVFNGTPSRTKAITIFHNVIALLKADSRNVNQIVSKKGTSQNRLIVMISNDIIGQTIALLRFNVLVWPVFFGTPSTRCPKKNGTRKKFWNWKIEILVNKSLRTALKFAYQPVNHPKYTSYWN